jgi:hypothetical protein
VLSMAKAAAFLIIIFVLGFAFILFKGSAVVVPSDPAEPSPSLTPSLPDLDLKNKAAAAGEKIKSTAKEVATKTGNLVESKPTTSLKLDREVIEIVGGGKTDVKVTRAGGELKAESLQILPASGSMLSVSGGSYKPGQTETTISIVAQPGAHDSALTLKLGEIVKIAPVKIK